MPRRTIPVLLAFSLAGSLLAGCEAGPAQRLADHVEALSDIAHEHDDDCAKMGEQMQRYWNENKEGLNAIRDRLQEAAVSGDAQEVAEETLDALEGPLRRLDEAALVCRSDAQVASAVANTGSLVLATVSPALEQAAR